MIIYFDVGSFLYAFPRERVETYGSPPFAWDIHTCSSWRNKIIVLGGEDASDYYLSDVYILDTGIEWILYLFFPDRPLFFSIISLQYLIQCKEWCNLYVFSYVL